MATLGRAGSVALATRFARALAAELRAVGITLDFAPVLDVGTNPKNQVIGDRALSADAGLAGTLAAAVVRGLQDGRCRGVRQALPRARRHARRLARRPADRRAPARSTAGDRVRAVPRRHRRRRRLHHDGARAGAGVRRRVAGDAVGADVAPTARRARVPRRDPQRRSGDAGGARPVGAGRVGRSGHRRRLRRRARLQRRRRRSGGDARSPGQGGRVGHAAAGARRRRPGPRSPAPRRAVRARRCRPVGRGSAWRAVVGCEEHQIVAAEMAGFL